MKKTLLLAGILLAVSATVASASGLNLGWGLFCPTNASSMASVSDPCDGSSEANLLTYVLVGSVVTPSPAPTVCLAEDWFIDLQENAATLSDYWHLEDENQPGQLNAGGCRGGSTVTGNLGSLLAQISLVSYGAATMVGCNKAFWGNSPAGGVNYGVLIPDGYPGVVDPRRARLIGHFAKSPGTAMTAGLQYCTFNVTLDTNHQISDPLNPPAYVCAGCQDGVCLVYNELILYQPPGTPGGDYDITNESTRRFVTWQSAAGTNCPGPTPTHKATWGQVKSLYR
jgi:hypothetical protein